MGRIKRFENKAQLIRYISEQEDVTVGELWDKYDNQIDNE